MATVSSILAGIGVIGSLWLTYTSNRLAEAALVDAREATYQANRPWLTMYPNPEIPLRLTTQGKCQVSAGWIVKNTGNVPAKDVSVLSNVWSGVRQEDMTLDDFKGLPTERGYRKILAPGETISHSINVATPCEYLTATLEGKARVVIGNRILYSNPVSNRPHTTVICDEYGGRLCPVQDVN